MDSLTPAVLSRAAARLGAIARTSEVELLPLVKGRKPVSNS